MANAIYPKANDVMLGALINGATLAGGTLKAVLVDNADYTYSAAHQFYSSVSAAAVGTPTQIANLSITGGVLDGDDVTFTSVTGDEAEAIVIFVDTGNPATSPLLAFIDTGVTGLPVTPNGGDILIGWHASGIVGP